MCLPPWATFGLHLIFFILFSQPLKRYGNNSWFAGCTKTDTGKIWPQTVTQQALCSEHHAFNRLMMAASWILGAVSPGANSLAFDVQLLTEEMFDFLPILSERIMSSILPLHDRSNAPLWRGLRGLSHLWRNLNVLLNILQSHYIHAVMLC